MADSLRESLTKLASKIELRAITASEATILEQKAIVAKSADRETVEQILSESLGETRSNIRIKLAAAHDDTDRLIDDIVNELKKNQ